MPNTIAIGVPDKVSGAERGKKAKNKIRPLDIFVRSLKHLPKGYTAKDAYLNSFLYVSQEFLRPIDYLSLKRLPPYEVGFHFMVDMGDVLNKDIANFYLLLAYANGFKD